MGAATAIQKIIATLIGCAVGGSLVTLAYRVQGGLPSAMLPYGCALGAAIGLAVAAQWVRLHLAAASVGAVSALTLFQCLPCDGSNFIMPVFGFVAGWEASRLVTAVARFVASPAAKS